MYKSSSVRRQKEKNVFLVITDENYFLIVPFGEREISNIYFLVSLQK